MVYVYNLIICAPFFRVKDTVVRGCEKVSKEEVIKLAGIDPSVNILSVSLGRMEGKIKANPWVKDVYVGREFPDRLVIEVVERDCALLLRSKGKLYIADHSGKIFKEAVDGDNVDLPILTGFFNGGYLDQDLMDRALEFLGCVVSRNAFPGIRDISEVYGDDVYGFSLLTNNRMLIEFGLEDYKEKLKRLDKVMADLPLRYSAGDYLGVDLTNYDRVVVRRVNVKTKTRNLSGGLSI
jgi:cell division protein FtsQ